MMKTPKIELPIRTLLVDDEYRSRSSLRILLEHHFPDVVVVGEAETITEGVALARSSSPDLVFLDVMLPDGSAFDFLEIVKDLHFHVVIISAYAEHSLRAFQYDVLQYLLKPYDIRDLEAAIGRVHAKGKPNEAVQEVAPFVGKNLALKTIEGFELVALEDIAFCEADGSYTNFHFTNRKPILVTHALGNYEDMLSGQGFYRVHHRYLVNLRHVKAYMRGRGGYLEMVNGESVEVSVRKRDQFLERLGKWALGL